MSYFMCECKRGDFGRNTRAVVDKSDDAGVEAFIHTTVVLVVFFPALAQTTRRLCT